MKKLVALSAVSLLIIATSCEKAKDEVNSLTEFDISYSTDVTVPLSTYIMGDSVDVSTPEIATNSASKFSSENTTASLVSEIKLTKFNLSVSPGNLDHLKSIKIFIRTTNLGDVLIASKSNIPAGSASVSADLKGINIKDYIIKDKIQFRAVIVWNSGFTGDKKLKSDVTIHVKATLIK
jgi:hypothetical protein